MKFGPFRLFEKKSLPQTDDDLAALLGLSASTDPLCVPPVAAAVRTIGEAVATLDINVIKRDATGEKVDHASLALLLGQVNDWTSGFELIRDLVTQALTRDAGGMAWVNRVNDRIAEIIRYEPGRITAQYASDGSGEPTYSLNGRPLNASDVIHVRGPFSKSPVSLARGAICTAATMEAHARRQFETGAKPGAVVTVPKGMGEDSIRKMRAGFRSAYEGAANAGKTVFIYDGATFTTAQISSVDAQFLELRRFQIEEIARAFNMPASMLGDLTKSSYANAEQKQKEFLAYCADPWLCAVEAAFNRALLSDDERATLTFKFDRDDLTRASLTERATAINSLIASETINPNTGRDWLGLPAYTGGETYGNRNITVAPPAKPKPEAA
jgi:HK97 family phage portal protein